MNGKTQRPVRFSYQTAELNGVTIGVFTVPVQTRPLYLKSDFGKLKANVVYLRRGSSTAEASLDEVAQMGATASRLSNSDLSVTFAEPNSRKLSGSSISLKCAVITIDGDRPLPDFEESDGLRFSLKKPNRDWFRELGRCAQQANLLRAAALTVTNNVSGAAATW